MLDTNKKINRKMIQDLFNAPPDEVYDALTSVATLDETKTWTFLSSKCEDV